MKPPYNSVKTIAEVSLADGGVPYHDRYRNQRGSGSSGWNGVGVRRPKQAGVARNLDVCTPCPTLEETVADWLISQWFVRTWAEPHTMDRVRVVSTREWVVEQAL